MGKPAQIQTIIFGDLLLAKQALQKTFTLRAEWSLWPSLHSKVFRVPEEPFHAVISDLTKKIDMLPVVAIY